MMTTDRRDEYLIRKFAYLQLAARQAQADIDAIPQSASAGEEIDAVRFALAPVERRAQSLMLIEAHSTPAATAKDRVRAWLDGGKLVCLAGPLELTV